jgi:hypothetical protein
MSMEVNMARKKSRSQQAEQLEKESAEQVKLDPLAAAERYRNLLSIEVDRAVSRILRTVGDKQRAALLNAGRAWTRYHDACSKQMADITGRHTYYSRMDSLYRRLPTDELKSSYRAMAMQGMMKTSLPEEGEKILAALREAFPPKQSKIFEGENEWQEYLAKNNLVEAEPPDIYKPRRIFPSPE